MMQDQYVDKIISEIERSSILKKELKDDLIDHFCCLVEIDMNKGLGFEEAYQRAFEQTCPNGLDEIQKETIFLLNYNRIIFMKRLTYAIGFLSSLSLGIGIFLKLMNFSGTGILSLIGVIGLVFLFLPLVLANRFKHLGSHGTIEKLKWIFGSLSAFTFAMACLFKVMHLQGAILMLGLAFLFFTLGFLPFLFFRMYKKSIQEI